MILRPMLAEAVTEENESRLRFPYLATPKLDGIRCLTRPTPDGGVEAVSRKLKPIPNVFIREWIQGCLRPGLDGEIVAYSQSGEVLPFNECSSAVMGHKGEPIFKFVAFDYMKGNPDTPYSQRVDDLASLRLPRSRTAKLVPELVTCMAELRAYEGRCLEDGYEGVILRCPYGPYKFGRSTFNEHYLLKLKRFVDSEFLTLGYREMMRNENEAVINRLGYTERSTAAAGMAGAGVLGALECKDIYTNELFSLSGFTARQRAELWESRDAIVGKIGKYKFQPHGVKDAPRFPVFLGWRSLDDL